MKLITTRNGEKQERILASEEEWLGVVRHQFGIPL
jgi:hypothetical protein